MQKSFNDRISTHMFIEGGIRKDSNKKASESFVIDFVEII